MLTTILNEAEIDQAFEEGMKVKNLSAFALKYGKIIETGSEIGKSESIKSMIHCALVLGYCIREAEQEKEARIVKPASIELQCSKCKEEITSADSFPDGLCSNCYYAQQNKD